MRSLANTSLWLMDTPQNRSPTATTMVRVETWFTFSVALVSALQVGSFQAIRLDILRKRNPSLTLLGSQKGTCDNGKVLQPCRRALLVATIASAASSSLLLPFESSLAQEGTESAAVVPENITILKGTVSLPSDLDEFNPSEASALYITCRPDKPDNVPLAILNGSRGKPPPVLSARIGNPTFPYEFELSSPRDLTIEGASDGESKTAILDYTKFWWKNDDLIVSARWDSDGVAATRSPEDLVGRGIWKQADKTVSVPLSGRGAFGKFATGSKQK